MSNKNTPVITCAQEPRLLQLEIGVAAIGETLKDVKDLLKSSIQTDERVSTLKQENSDQEKRIRKLEAAVSGGRWLERLAWAVMAAGLSWFFHKG